MVSKNTQSRIDEILDVTEDHMRQGGFDAVSFRDIATAVGIKSSSVHYHFPHKSDLGKAVVERYAENFIAALGPADAQAEDAHGRINRLGAAYIGALSNKGTICLGCILGSELPSLPEEVGTAVQIFFDRLLAWTAKALGGSRDDLEHAQFIVGSFQGAMTLSVAMKDPKILSRCVERLCNSNV
ncbi:MAG: TetR/AcrR family transcriptional regulator [Sneathiella sp.]|nr:TetR/AcrR family transcriptional regulator [Sneathiella sp.]